MIICTWGTNCRRILFVYQPNITTWIEIILKKVNSNRTGCNPVPIQHIFKLVREQLDILCLHLFMSARITVCPLQFKYFAKYLWFRCAVLQQCHFRSCFVCYLYCVEGCQFVQDNLLVECELSHLARWSLKISRVDQFANVISLFTIE